LVLQTYNSSKSKIKGRNKERSVRAPFFVPVIKL
jgi:hypothetical protein